MAPIKSTTLYVKYRVGGGVSSNVGVGTIDSLGIEYVNIYGPDATINQNVKDSLAVVNITPAVGGSDQPSIEEIKHHMAYNFAAQQRAVTLRDYNTIALTMPSKFGSPARVGITQNRNKVEINVLTFDGNSKFENLASSIMMENMAEYLSEYRMINDYVVIKPGEIVDLGFEINVQVEEGSQINTTTRIIKEIADEFAAVNMDMGKSFYVGKLLKKVANVSGVLNTNYIKIFNKTGNGYSTNRLNQIILDEATGEVDTTSGVLLVNQNQILQVRNPNVDIVVVPVVSNPRRLG